ncbi:hypothetical protein ACSHT0_10820 [Tepidicaulis sp. LMO-SS28]|uniref:hypothetical protein n=1 Tax=Tepidicaulis sp. LMO-SS28 TaxID=3447455 RepID=UPI003EE0FF18
MSVNPFAPVLNKKWEPEAPEAAIKAAAALYHAYFTGLMLHLTLRKGAATAGEWTFRLFRRQHLEKFKSSFDKLGVTHLPDAVAAAQYHYLSNSVGGVEVEFIPESDTKAWVHFCHPRWMFQGTALCGLPVEVSRGFLTGWYGHNGVSLNNPRLGFVCVSEDMTGQYGLSGYFKEFDHELAPHERLQFAPGEICPPFDAAKAPVLDTEAWPAARLIKANRNYAMDYIKTGLNELCALLGPAEARDIAGHAAALIGRQFYREMQALMGLPEEDDSPEAFARFMTRIAEAQDDKLTWEMKDGALLLSLNGWRLMRGRENVPHEAYEAWLKLWEGCLAVHNRFLKMELIAREDYGDPATVLRVRKV